jgi:hypothetical protein
MKATILFICTFFTATVLAQSDINNYKYVLVPEKYDFLREADQYGLNTVTKMLLEQKGFVAFLAGEQLPAELAANKCNALMAEVVQKKSLFVTNLTLTLKDCQGNVVFKSKEGKSREKDFHPAFNLALRDAFTSLDDVPYKYNGTVAAQAQQATAPTTAPATAPTTTAPTTTPAAAATDINGTLYAQAITNGYQLVDTTPKKVLTLLKTSAQDYFIAQAGAISGIVFKKDGAWVYEYYEGDKLVSKTLEIRF